MCVKIALGFGNSVDYEIMWNSAVLEDLIRRYRIHNVELNVCGQIHSERDLVISILGFMNVAGGGERFVSHLSVIERFASRFVKKITLGGTSVRAAIAMRKLGHASALHLVTVNEHVRRLIPADSPYVCSNTQDTSYPHLIVQFGKDARVCAGDIDIRASKPNRLIYDCNADNIELKLNQDFADLLAGAKVLLISGFNAMQSRQLLEDRLQTLLRMMERMREDATVFFEDGGYYDPCHRQRIIRTLGQKIDVYSLNEDELQIHLNRKVELHDIKQVCAALADLHQLVPAATIVVHTRYWALAHGDCASKYAYALRAGVTLATTRFRFGDDFTLADHGEIEKRAPLAENARFAAAINARFGDKMLCVAVAAVEQTNATTIGLGDAFVGGFLPALLS